MLRNAPARPNQITRPSTVDLLPPPQVLGMPDKFTAWRPLQQEAVVAAADSEKRFIFQCAPTGFGKSPVYMAEAKLAGTRTIILTSTKGLQTQLEQDFGSMGLVDIRGQNAYTCVEASNFGYAPSMNVSEAPCHWGRPCAKRDGGCSYYDKLRTAQKAGLVVTNYTYWMHIQAQEKNLGEFDLMICDEAHNTPDELASFLTIEVDEVDIGRILQSQPMGTAATVDDWRAWAQYHNIKLTEKLLEMNQMQKSRPTDKLTRDIREYKHLNQSLEKLSIMSGEWVIDRREDKIGQGMRAGKKVVWQFDPVWPNLYAERHLFRKTAKVVLFSATVRPKTAGLLGIREGEYDFNEYPSSFPVDRRPVYHIPTVKVGFKTSEGEMALWLNRIDQIIDARKERKGIVHTTSFRLRNFLLQNSAHRTILISNDSRNTRPTVEEFKKSTRPLVFISPSLTTGWDFPYTECEYQIIGKIMFPNTQSPIMKARAASDKDWSSYMAMQTLVQACGRGMRAADDQCETFIIDDNIGWFIARYKNFAPTWWLETLKTSKLVPPPLPKLRVAIDWSQCDVCYGTNTGHFCQRHADEMIPF